MAGAGVGKYNINHGLTIALVLSLLGNIMTHRKALEGFMNTGIETDTTIRTMETNMMIEHISNTQQSPQRKLLGGDKNNGIEAKRRTMDANVMIEDITKTAQDALPIVDVLGNSTAETSTTTATSNSTQGGETEEEVFFDKRKNSGSYWMSMANLSAVNASTDVLFPEKVSELLQRDKETLNEKNTFSSCLLFMDDNHRLSEWLAYHYYSLNLRRLIMAIDPRSQTSPAEILQSWDPLIDITLWSDDDYTFDRDWTKVNESDVQMKTINHRIRQATFYRDCSYQLKKESRRWTIYHDVDEYVTMNPKFVNDTEKRMQEPGGVVGLFLDLKRQNPVPTHYNKNCITIPRVLFGAVNSTQEEIRRGVPAPLQERADQFETLHYRHSARVNAPDNGAVKSIMDVRYAPRKRMYSVHAVAGSRHCSSRGVKETHLVMHHYLGSWEYYTARDDARRGQDRNRLRWKLKAQAAHVKNVDTVRPWIGGFWNLFGEDLATHLLEPVGVLEAGNNITNFEDWVLQSQKKRKRRGRNK